jgi:hypothetical protein
LNGKNQKDEITNRKRKVRTMKKKNKGGPFSAIQCAVREPVFQRETLGIVVMSA